MLVLQCIYCGEPLKYHENEADGVITVEPCDNCIEETRESAYQDGYDSGYNTGYVVGYDAG